MKNYHILTVKYLGPTNYRGSRVRITSERFNQSVILSYDYQFNTAYEQAETYLTGRGFNVLGHGEGKNTMFIITDTFEPLKKV
jgi:hypothetical protein